MQYKAVIYDCDGVMFDSFEANLLFYDRIMGMLGKPLLDRGDGELMHILHTRASQDVLRHIFPDEAAWNAAVRCIPAVDYGDLIPFMRMEEGFRETLDTLAPLVELAVCTNRANSSTDTPDKTAREIFAPMPLTFCSVRNSTRSLSRRNP